MEIRTVQHKDLPHIAAIYNQAVAAGFQTADTEPWRAEDKQDWLVLHQQPEYPLFVAVENGAVIGFATISAYRPGRGALAFTKEISYYVHADYIRRGVGLKLLQHAIQTAPVHNTKTLIAMVLDVNMPSIALLQKAGFALWGHLPNIASFGGVCCGHVYYGRHL